MIITVIYYIFTVAKKIMNINEYQILILKYVSYYKIVLIYFIS